MMVLNILQLIRNPTPRPKSTFWGRVEIGEVYLPSQLERTPQLCSVRDGRYCTVKRGGRVSPTNIMKPGLIFPSCWNARQKFTVATLCTL